ncbi:MAG TPA: LysR substrate-binding domain-containing protein [Ancylobacter sp.]
MLMRERRHRVPLHRLAVFEAAARHGSFSKAAREFGMTQSAVSHQIADLETELGILLFQRVWRGVTTTEAGTFLFEALGRSLGEIAAAVDVARALGRRSRLTVVTDFGFAAFWLMPRLADLRAKMPGVDVRVITQQGAGDPAGEPSDLAILFGAGQWRKTDAVRLIAEDVVPIASPGFLQERPIRAVDDLAHVPLLHLEAPDADRWISWDEYRQACGAVLNSAKPPVHSGLSFNNYMLVIQAAIAGQGVALGWRPLVDDLLRQDLVVEVPLPRIVTERGYYLVSPGRASQPRTAEIFRKWLLREFDDLGAATQVNANIANA